MEASYMVILLLVKLVPIITIQSVVAYIVYKHCDSSGGLKLLILE